MLRDEELTYCIRGAVYEVNKVLGPGFLEAVYQNSLAYELRQRGLEVQAEVPVVVNYKGQPVGEHRLGLLVNRAIVLELKAQLRLPLSAEPQLINYLKATGHRTGLLINFTFPKATIKRIVL